jgi:hypothetical protein
VKSEQKDNGCVNLKRSTITMPVHVPINGNDKVVNVKIPVLELMKQVGIDVELKVYEAMKEKKAASMTVDISKCAAESAKKKQKTS